MTYQGERAQPADSEINRVFEVSQVRLGAQGRVTEVRWCFTACFKAMRIRRLLHRSVMGLMPMAADISRLQPNS